MCMVEFFRLFIAAVGALAGCFLIWMGVGHTQIIEELQTLIEEAKVPKPQYVLIATGAIIICVSIVSLLDAVQNSELLKLIYCAVMDVIIAGLIIIAILVFIKHDKFYKQTVQIYDNTWEDRKSHDASQLIDSINKFLHCCGLYSSADYLGSIPPSCCDEPVDDVCPITNIYKDGCRKALVNFVASNVYWIGYGSIAVAFMFAFLLLASLCQN